MFHRVRWVKGHKITETNRRESDECELESFEKRPSLVRMRKASQCDEQ